MKDLLWVSLFVLLVMVVIAGSVFWILDASCDQVGDQVGVEVQYRFPSGCFVNIDGRWVPEETWRINELLRGEL